MIRPDRRRGRLLTPSARADLRQIGLFLLRMTALAAAAALLTLRHHGA